MMSFSDAVKTCFIKKYAKASGRASRSEFWWYQLFIWSVVIILVLIAIAIDENGISDVISIIALIFYLVNLIPSFCARIRRLHDTDHSGWTLLWQCIPYIGGFAAIYIFILECMAGDKDENQYGPNPLMPIFDEELEDSEYITSSVDNNEEITDVDL